MPNSAVDFGILVGSGVQVRSYAEGEKIFHEGDPGLELFVVEAV
jgi:CRP-like cAMP-binding protein